MDSNEHWEHNQLIAIFPFVFDVHFVSTQPHYSYFIPNLLKLIIKMSTPPRGRTRGRSRGRPHLKRRFSSGASTSRDRRERHLCKIVRLSFEVHEDLAKIGQERGMCSLEAVIAMLIERWVDTYEQTNSFNSQGIQGVATAARQCIWLHWANDSED